MEKGDTGVCSDNSKEVSNSTEKVFCSPYAVKEVLEDTMKERVRVLLRRVGRSQNWLAEQCNISHGCMSQIINEKWKPSSNIMVRMGECLDCDSVVLFGSCEYWKNWNDKIVYDGVENE